MLCLLSLSKGISDQEMRAVDTELSGLARQARPDKAVSKAAMASKKSDRDPRSFEETPNLFGSAGTRSHAKRSAASLSHVSRPLAERQAWHRLAGSRPCRLSGPRQRGHPEVFFNVFIRQGPGPTRWPWQRPCSPSSHFAGPLGLLRRPGHTSYAGSKACSAGPRHVFLDIA